VVNFQVVLITDDNEVWLSLRGADSSSKQLQKSSPFFRYLLFQPNQSHMDEFKEHTHKLVQLVIRIIRQVVSSFKFRHFESRKKQEETGEIAVQEIRSSKRKISSKRKLELIAKTSAATHLAAGQISRVSGGSCSILV